MIYGGIDYSITCPCLCIYNDKDGAFSHDTCTYFFQKSSKAKIQSKDPRLQNINPSIQYSWKNDQYRFLALADYFLSILIQYDVKVVAMEGYAMAAKGKVFDIAECTSSLKQFMALTGIEFVTFPPPYVKRIFSGKGNASKEEMCDEYLRKYGVDISSILNGKYSSPVSDIVDSHAMLFTLFNGDKNFCEL